MIKIRLGFEFVKNLMSLNLIVPLFLVENMYDKRRIYITFQGLHNNMKYVTGKIYKVGISHIIIFMRVYVH